MMMLVSMVGMFATGGRGGGKRTTELAAERRDYFRYLAQLRGQITTTVDEQSAALRWCHPTPTAPEQDRRVAADVGARPRRLRFRAPSRRSRIATTCHAAGTAGDGAAGGPGTGRHGRLASVPARPRSGAPTAHRGVDAGIPGGGRRRSPTMYVPWHGPCSCTSPCGTGQIKCDYRGRRSRCPGAVGLGQKWLPHAARPDRGSECAHPPGRVLLVDSLQELESALSVEFAERTCFTRVSRGPRPAPGRRRARRWAGDGRRTTGRRRRYRRCRDPRRRRFDARRRVAARPRVACLGSVLSAETAVDSRTSRSPIG